MPKVVVHNPVLAYENGAEFMQAWYDAEAGKLDPFVLVVEGSIPNEKINGEGHWAGDRQRPGDRAADHHQRVGRPAGAQGGGRGGRRHLRHLRRHPRHEEQPDRRHGPARLPGLEVEVRGRPAGRLHPRLPRPAGQHDRDADVPRVPPRGHGSRPPSWTRRCGPSGCSSARCARAATAPASPSRASSPPSTATTRAAWSSWAARGRWSSATCRSAAGSSGKGGCPNVGGICMACTMPGFPDKYMPFMEPGPVGQHGLELPEVRLRARGEQLRHRNIEKQYDKEPEWRHNRGELTTGYAKRW